MGVRFRKNRGKTRPVSLTEAVFEATEVGICITDRHHRYVKVNPAYCRIYGYEAHELIGQSFTLVVPPPMHGVLQKLHDDFIEGKAEIAAEWQVLRKDGRPLHIYATASLLANVPGGPYKITTVSDITELKAEQEKQKRQEQMLIQQSKMALMGEMIGAIAHQWKQPLSAIQGATLNLSLRQELETLDAAAVTEAVEQINRQSDFMAHTITDFSGFFRPGRTAETFNLHQSVEKLRVLFGAQLKQHGITLENKIDEALEITGLKNQLKQALINLLANARDAYEAQTGGTRRIILRAWTEAERTLICVEDEAGGIDEAVLKRLGEPYFTTKTEGKGTGFGLYLSRLILRENFGGDLSVENRYDAEGKRIGARFTLTLSNAASAAAGLPT
ncbi:MAG: PAS domain S-box protein [Campylobacterales bacterium]